MKWIITGYDIANYAYKEMVREGVLPKAPEGKRYNWKFSMPDPSDHKSTELLLVLEDKEPEPEKEPYKAGGWRDPDLLLSERES